MFSRLIFVLALATLCVLAKGNADLVANIYPKASPRSLEHVRRGLAEVAKRKQVFSNSTSLDKSFSGVTLFKYEGTAKNTTGGDKDPNGGKEQTITASAGIEIICSTCYTKGKATATLSVSDSFNATEAVDEIKDSVSDTIHELNEYVDNLDFNFTDFELYIPPPNITLDIDVPAFPDTVLEFNFDGVELYVEIDMIISSGISYQLTLFKSEGELGIQLTDDLFLGLIFSIDLILSVESEITISSGFHLKLDDGVLLKLALFSKQTSDLNFNGGQFEFLPVTIESAGTVLKAILQLSLRSGFSFATPDLTPGSDVTVFGFDLDNLKASTGVESRVYANVAELVTNVTDNLAPGAKCALNVVQEYRFVVGAAAGATVGIGEHVWGPSPATEVPIFYTTLADVCAISGTPSATVAARAPADDGDLTTTTLSTEEMYTATGCISTGLLNCPASLQSISENIATKTLVTSVSSGVDATWPASTTLAVLSTVAFGDNVKNMVSATGTPKPYKPKPHHDNGDGILHGKTGGVSNKLIIGLSVGLGLPFLIAVVAGIIICLRRRTKTTKYTAANLDESPTETRYNAPEGDTRYNGTEGFKHATHEVVSIGNR